MRELCLEGNRLATPVLDLRALSGLQALQLYGNPLEYIPELSPCTVRSQVSRYTRSPASGQQEALHSSPPA